MRLRASVLLGDARRLELWAGQNHPIKEEVDPKEVRFLKVERKDLILAKWHQLDKKLKAFFKSNGPSLMEIRIRTGSIKNLLRPKNLKDIKENFIKK